MWYEGESAYVLLEDRPEAKRPRCTVSCTTGPLQKAYLDILWVKGSYEMFHVLCNEHTVCVDAGCCGEFKLAFHTTHATCSGKKR